MNIHILQHVPFEGPASIRGWIERGGHAVGCTRLYAGDDLPRPELIDLLIVLGGPMGVHDIDAYPWLVPEKTFLRAVIGTDARVLGICLGAQLIADVLGARVYRNDAQEIGWFPVTRCAGAEATPFGAALPERFMAFHWHGDTFELPSGAVHLAESAACRQQAYAVGARILGLQFHLETTPGSARELIEHGGDERVAAPTIQSAEDMLAETAHFAEINRLMFALLDALTADRQAPTRP
ncbi:MAG: type 1 glutamine amidotransferase [Gammaproteobacteria bacterium]